MNEIFHQRTMEDLMEKEANQQGYNDLLCTKNNICKKFMHSVCENPNCKYIHDLSKAVPCRNYVQSGYCAKGNLCNYLHQNQTQNTNQKQGSVPCITFRDTNFCIEGNNCPYKHSKIICKDYEQGFCVKGNDCKALHQETFPCRNYLLGFCPQGPNCNFAHPKTIYNLDFHFLKSWNKEVNIGRCNNCDELGHKEIQCTKEVAFSDINEYYKKYRNNQLVIYQHKLLTHNQQ